MAVKLFFIYFSPFIGKQYGLDAIQNMNHHTIKCSCTCGKKITRGFVSIIITINTSTKKLFLNCVPIILKVLLYLP